MGHEIIPGYSVEKFLQSQDEHLWSQQTRASYQKFLNEAKEYFGIENPVSKDSLEQWRQDLEDKNYKQRSINTRISAMNGYLKWCGRFDLVMPHKRPQKSGDVQQITRGEYLCLLRAAKHQGKHKLYLLIKAFTILDIPVHCLDQVTVELVKAGKGNIIDRSNNIIFRCPPGFQRELIHYAKSIGITSGPIFVSRTGQTVSRSSICRMFQELSKEAKLPENKVNPRSLRYLGKKTRENIFLNMEQVLIQAYDNLLETENTIAGWEESAGIRQIVWMP